MLKSLSMARVNRSASDSSAARSLSPITPSPAVPDAGSAASRARQSYSRSSPERASCRAVSVKSSGLRYWVEKIKSRSTSGSYWARTSRMVRKLPSDFDIFSSLMVTKPWCIHSFAKPAPVAPQLWAISFS